MDADAAAADLPAVEHDVVGLGQHTARVALQLVPVLVARAGEGMMHGLPAFLLVVVLQQREVDHPAEGQQVRVDQVGALADLQAQVAQALRHHARLVGHDQDQVADLGPARAHDRAQFVGRQELGHLRTQRLAGIVALPHPARPPRRSRPSPWRHSA